MSAGEQLVFDKYRVIRRIAVGGMGEIFLARQVGVAGFDRLVILKTMLPDLVEEEGFLDQFLDEARVAATLNHPNIVSIYEVGQWQGVYIISMEYIKGDHLGRLIQGSIKQQKPIPQAVTAKIVHDAAMALDHAHFARDTEGNELGIVHRDIGLQNIMVRLDGVTKVVDFGVARAANRSTRTRTGLVKGKLPYMSPEQAAGSHLDHRSDQFSLGVVLWELTTRRRLFKADNDLVTLRKLIHEPIPPPSSAVPDYPPALEAVVMRMLQRDRELRFPRCQEAANALKAYLDSLGTTVNENTVSDFVRDVLAEKLEEETLDLTPSRESPFAAAYGLGGATPTGMSAAETDPRGATGGSRRGLLVGLLAVAAIAAGGLFFGLRGTDPVPVADAILEIDGPKGARVIVDGKTWREQAPTVVTGLSPGPHEVRLELEGRPPIVKPVALESGRTNKFSRLRPQRGTALNIRSPAGAQVVIDGAPWPETSPTLITGLEPGAHAVRLELPGLPAIEREVTLTDGELTEVAETAPVVSTTLTLQSVPAGAEVRLGDLALGKTPLTVDSLAPGQLYQLVLRLEGYRSSTVTVTLEPGEAAERSVTLQKQKHGGGVKRPPREVVQVVQPEEPAGPGFLSIRTTPWTKIFIDGKPYGSTPLYKESLPSGKHKVRLVNEQLKIDVTRRITVKPGQTEKLDLKLGG